VSSWLGWTTITRGELAAAQQVNQLVDRGVRDELGVSAIHFLYAERFFPGTSVQLTRLRYIFFVAGLYELLRRKPAPMDLDDAVAQAERRTAFQLLAWHSRHHQELEGSGIIGRTIVHAHAPVLLPSMSYWTPLSRWGVLAPNDAGSQAPSRAAVHGDWNRYRRRKGHPGEVDTRAPLFNLELETYWENHIGGDLRAVGDGRTPLTFALTHWERSFLKRRLSSLEMYPGGPAPLIAHLAALPDSKLAAASKVRVPWAARVLESLPPKHPDRETMQRARNAAYLVQIARAVYDVLVATLINEHDRVHLGEQWASEAQQHLWELCRPSSTAYQLGSTLDLEGLRADSTIADSPVDNGLMSLVRKTQEWLKSDSHDPKLLARIMRDREIAKKTKGRARLLPEARDRRLDWEFSRAQPLEYRWSVVSRLLSDLAGVP